MKFNFNQKAFDLAGAPKARKKREEAKRWGDNVMRRVGKVKVKKPLSVVKAR